jgi:hypothetical protein
MAMLLGNNMPYLPQGKPVQVDQLFHSFLNCDRPHESNSALMGTPAVQTVPLPAGPKRAAQQNLLDQHAPQLVSSNDEGRPEEKKLRRREQNRRAAVKSRKRKKVYLQELEKKVKTLEDQNQTIMQRLQAMIEENARLKAQQTQGSALTSPPLLEAPREQQAAAGVDSICRQPQATPQLGVGPNTSSTFGGALADIKPSTNLMMQATTPVLKVKQEKPDHDNQTVTPINIESAELTSPKPELMGVSSQTLIWTFLLLTLTAAFGKSQSLPCNPSRPSKTTHQCKTSTRTPLNSAPLRSATSSRNKKNNEQDLTSYSFPVLCPTAPYEPPRCRPPHLHHRVAGFVT